MPEILKKPNGDVNWSSIFMGFAMATVLVLQQIQTMEIATIKTQAEVNSINFMDKGRVNKFVDDLEKRLEKLEEKCNDR